MEIECQYRFGLPRTLVWKYIKNATLLKDSIPGCKSLIEKSAGYYIAETEINLGPIQDVFKLEVHLDEEKPPALLRLKLKGNGNMGQIKGGAKLIFIDHQGGTLLTCKAKGQVTGALGLAGKKLLDTGASKGIENFFQRFEKEIKRRIYELKKRRN
ncbi:SRPBCC domain-containing protein [Bacillus sp. USDA818B3_A]|uniref:SRPBCC domain-containing protein n=1 Tax=Bacillus sp. USDA818B3_A TaxID=2698834 RepID=UPI00136BA635|nr:SRPBCC domain-containing protein [Bacillus sp. USDA818B3_A]